MRRMHALDARRSHPTIQDQVRHMTHLSKLSCGFAQVEPPRFLLWQKALSQAIPRTPGIPTECLINARIKSLVRWHMQFCMTRRIPAMAV
jgi:hypothetical protein